MKDPSTVPIPQPDDGWASGEADARQRSKLRRMRNSRAHLEALRLARTSPSTTLHQIADSVHVSEETLSSRLRSLPHRGWCARAAAEATRPDRQADLRVAGYNDTACPPGVLRAAGLAAASGVLFREDTKRIPSWARRHAAHDNAPRASLMRGDDRFLPSHPQCPPAALIPLTAITYWEPRAHIAANPAAPAAAVALLTQDLADEVRAAAAANEHCPTYLLETLSDDDDYKVQVAVASNSICPSEILQVLANHYIEPVRRPAQWTLRSRGRVW